MSTHRLGNGGRPEETSAAWRKRRSNRTLCPTMTAEPMNSRNAGSTASIHGAGRTMASVMPVRKVISRGIPTPGFTSVWKVPRHSPPRSFTAPTSVMADCGGAAPVVSKSRTQNVT